MVYYLIATTLLQKDKNYTWNQISNELLSGAFSKMATGKQLESDNKFKLGNLDSLMYFYDQIIKMEALVENILKKIDRQYCDMLNKTNVNFEIELKNGKKYTIENYLQNFEWEEAKFPRQNDLKKVISSLAERINLIDSDLKKKIQQYQDVKNQHQNLQKKEGNLYTKDLVDILKPPLVTQEEFYNTQYLQTLIAIIPKGQIKEWLKDYQKIHENIIPGSTKQFKFQQDDDKEGLTLWRVVILKLDDKKQQEEKEKMEEEKKEEELNEEEKAKKEENKKAQLTITQEVIIKAREKRYTLREFDFVPDKFFEREQQRNMIQAQHDNLSNTLVLQCEKGYCEIYIIYIHLKHLRMYIDMTMRFGFGENMLICLLKPANGKEQKVTQTLTNLFVDPSQRSLYGTKEQLDDNEDFFPFICIQIPIH